jgi:O-antigen ligase
MTAGGTDVIGRAAARGARGAIALPLVAAISIVATVPQAALPVAIALAIAGLTFWRPGVGLLLLVALAPAGRLFAPAPIRAAELFAWSFLAAWLLAIWRPLGVPPRSAAVLATLYYCAALIASWTAFTVAGAAGVSIGALPSFVAHAIRPDYLVQGSEQSETWTMLQGVAGVGVLLAACGIVRSDARTARALAPVVVISTTILALASVAEVARQWAGEEYGLWFLLRYARGERFSLHLTDLNAAGSLYAMAIVAAAALATCDLRRRWPGARSAPSRYCQPAKGETSQASGYQRPALGWVIAVAAMLPATWLAGSRTSFVAIGAGLLLLAGIVSRWHPTRRQKTVVAAAVVVFAIGAVLTADWRTDQRGAAGRAVSLRSQFTESSLRMFGTAPVTGVGIGQYFNRSAEFFTPELRRLYGNENAHNYFMQQLVELGAIGGILFLALVSLPLAQAWRTIRHEADATRIALFSGAVAYLLTCVTGHPLLVPEASFPFWAVLGSVAAFAAPAAHPRAWQKALLAATLVFFVVEIGGATRSYAAITTPPGGYGFHELQTDEDGESFRWMTSHAVAYVGNTRGFLRLRVKAPLAQGRPFDSPNASRLAQGRPWVLETLVEGRVADRRELPGGQWATFDVPVRRETAAPFRRVDLKLNQIAWEEVTLGIRAAQRPIGVKVAEIRWIPLP